MSAEHEIVDVDAFELDVEYICTISPQRQGAQKRRVKNTRKPSPEIIDLEDDDEPMTNEASSSRIQLEHLRRPSPPPKTGSLDKSPVIPKRSNVSPKFYVFPGQPRLKRKKSEYSDMRLDNDSEFEVQNQLITQRVKVTDPSDSEEDYANIHSGLDNSFQNWRPFRDLDPEPIVAEPIPQIATPQSAPQSIHVSCPTLNAHRKIARRFDQPTRFSSFHRGPTVWSALRNSFPIPNCPKTPSTMPSTRQTLQRDVQLHSLKCSKHYREAPGAIHRIVQSSGIIAFCGAAYGGQPDEDNEEPNVYNRPGSLMVYSYGKIQNVLGHDRERRRRNIPSFYKYYTVNDVVLDDSLSPTCMITSGHDCAVRIWSCSSNESTSSLSVSLEQTISYKLGPIDLALKPGEPIFSVACRDGNVYIYPQLRPFDARAKIVFPVAPCGTPHAAGAMTWGLEATSHQLFASTEPYRDMHHSGYHRAFDLDAEKVLYPFDANDAGDAMALNCNGNRLAIFTRGRAGSHAVRIYDLGRKSGKFVGGTDLESFPPTLKGEVNRARYSPDNIYLAAARSDDVVHVYDSRMMERGVLHTFEHGGARRNFPTSFGVVELQWVESRARRLGLVTGGSDGCIRLWDVRKASDDPTNGAIIAQADSDIGHFSLGDVYKGEKALVIGDCDGASYIFDNTEDAL